MTRLTWKTAIAVMILIPIITAGLAEQGTAYADETPAAPKAADPMQFARGAQAWANSCARCHNMRDPKELRDDQWRGVVAHMRVRAGLTGKEARDILKFLQESN